MGSRWRDATFKVCLMKSLRLLVLLAAVATASAPQPSIAQHAEYDALVAAHARANNVPEALVHRIIVHESRYQPHLIGRGGTVGLMQIKLATARSLGYTGTAEGLRDPDTNLTYAVKYLAGAYRAANGDHGRAMAYYASGYYYAAKRLRHTRHDQPVIAGEVAKEAAKEPTDDPAGVAVQQVPKP
jgi:soluble lytic murein transglycosylase-like protein